MRGSRGDGGRGLRSPLGKLQRYRVPYQYWSGSPDKSQSYQDSIQYWAIISHLNGVSLKWRFAGGPTMAFVSTLNKTKNIKKRS